MREIEVPGRIASVAHKGRVEGVEDFSFCLVRAMRDAGDLKLGDGVLATIGGGHMVEKCGVLVTM